MGGITMHCPECGLEQFEDGTVCYNCGAKLPHQSSYQSSSQPPPGFTYADTSEVDTPPPYAPTNPSSSSPQTPYPPPSYDVYGSSQSTPAGAQPQYPHQYPPPNGSPNYPHVQKAPTKVRQGRPGAALFSLIIGVISLFIPIFIPSFIALILGIVALVQLHGGNYMKGKGMAVAGIVLGVVGIFISLAVWTYLVGRFWL